MFPGLQRQVPGSQTIASFKTAFPPLLIQLQGYLTRLKSLLDSALGCPVRGDGISGDDWQWDPEGGRARLEGLGDAQLLADWERFGRLHQGFLDACGAGLETCAAGDRSGALARLEQAFGLSRELVDLLVGASLRELMLAFSARERALASRYEQDFMEAAQIGRFAVRLKDHALLEADDAFLQFLGLAREEARGLDTRRLFDSDAYQGLIRCAANREPKTRARLSAKGRDGRKVPVEVVCSLEQDAGADLLRCFAVNVSQSESEIQQRRLLSTAIEASDQVVLITNREQEIVYVNPAFTRLSGYQAHEVLGKNPRFLQGPETSQATRMALREALATGRKAQAEMLNYSKEGLRYWVELSIVPVTDDGGEITHFVALERDITERKAAEQTMVRIALQDHLTGLPNRRAAEDRLGMEWNRAQRAAGGFAVAVVDVDRFKLVNDQYGHQVGDQALKHVTDVLVANLRRGDWVARWGGEEFLLCLHDMESRGAFSAAERMRKLIRSRPLRIPEGELTLSVSMGVCPYSPEHESIDSMLAQADSLLYEAKRGGRDKVLCAGRGNAGKGGTLWEGTQVQSALQDGRVLTAFQSIVDLRSGEIAADEALARIRGKDGSLVAAREFIPAAQALHLVTSIDNIVSSSALLQCAGAGGPPVHFINLSHQFLASGERVEALLAQARTCFPQRPGKGETGPLVIEITEYPDVGIAALKKNLQPLLDWGFRLALDDFGSGHASFRHLAELPVSFLKLEGWMVGRITRDRRVRQLVETMVGTARKFEVTTVAECVEDAQTAQVLCDIGVDWAQGRYFGEPQIA